MNREDLMIGDWILVDVNDWIEDEYDRNCGVVDYQPHQIQDGEELDYLENGDGKPMYMPLTEEILKKNDFKFNGLAYIGKWFDVSSNFDDKNAWDCGKFYTSGKGDPGFSDFCTIKYVHELQHLIKPHDKNYKIKI